MKESTVEILECTLRDGSYVVDFQFTPKDTAIIGAALERAGFELIEVGHGLGLNASQSGKGRAAASDVEYMDAAAGALKQAKWGMFFIPGIGRHIDLDLAAGHGMSFVRIGTDAPSVREVEPFIEHAKKLGLNVSVNLMKSYVLSPEQLAASAKIVADFGADMVVLVDSAGCMLPEDIRRYVQAMCAVINTPIGLHCHDNLGLGIANSLVAVDCGVSRIDSTLQGLGRGGGNPATEVLLTVLRKQGIDLGIDPLRVMDISQSLIKPLIHGKGWDPINLMSGFAGFHSSHLQTILKYSDRYKIDPRDLIVGVCELDQIGAPEEIVEEAARRLEHEGSGRSGLHIVSPSETLIGGTTSSATWKHLQLSEATSGLVAEIRSTSRKTARQAVLNIVADASASSRATVSQFVQEEFSFVIGNVTVATIGQLKEVVASAAEGIDILLVDNDHREFLSGNLADAASALGADVKIIPYSDSDVWVRSLEYSLAAMVDKLSAKHVVILGGTSHGLALAMRLSRRGAQVSFEGAPEIMMGLDPQLRMDLAREGAEIRLVDEIAAILPKADVVVAFEGDQPLVSAEMMKSLAHGVVVFDGSIGAITPQAIGWGLRQGVTMVRPDMRAALAGELTSLLGADRIVEGLMGRGEIAGVPIVAGGLVGARGDVVVDSIGHPARTIGVADGAGGLMCDEEEFCELRIAVERAIEQRLTCPEADQSWERR